MIVFPQTHTPSQGRWDDTPGRAKGSETPGATPGTSTRMWDATPAHATTPSHATPGHETPGHKSSGTTPSARRNRWDETPKTERSGETPGHGSGWAETPRTDRGSDLIQVYKNNYISFSC